MQDEFKQEEFIFEKSLEFEAPSERAAYLDRICEGRPELRRRLDLLLEGYSQAVDFLQDRSHKHFYSASSTIGERPGDKIGHYKLLEQIGEGGFGVVFTAMQDQPIQRKVALKIIKAGMDTKQVIARFEAERQALAMMDHPNIAKVHDAGATQSGRPYFVMEWVKGQPITQFCEENRLTLKERLELFIPLCEAIQHAHQKGVIHRDIKPPNVLVANNVLPGGERNAKSVGISVKERSDTEAGVQGNRRKGSKRQKTASEARPSVLKGQLKVIDFGVAKAIHQRLTERTLMTNSAQMIGTPAYMSPEQADLNGTNVDTRSDVYSLGILLYEILTGNTPFLEKRLREVGYAETQRIIREEEPARPSTHLQRKEKDFGNDSSKPNGLATLPPDMDWVVLKAIEKDRERRYATPLELAADLNRFLAHEPVLASPPGNLYILKKFAVRHRATVLFSLALILVLIAGIAASTWQAIRATRAESSATDALRQANAALQFVQEDLLTQFDPNASGVHRDVTLRDAVIKAAGIIGDRYADQPLVEAAIRLTIGEACRALGELEEAETNLLRAWELYEAALGSDADPTLKTGLALGWLDLDRSRYPEAIQRGRTVYQKLEQTLGPTHLQTLEALRLFGYALLWNSRIEEAEEVFNTALASIPTKKATKQRHQLHMTLMIGLIEALTGTGQNDRRNALAKDAFESSTSLLGPDHPTTLRAAVILYHILRSKHDKLKEAEALGEDTYARCINVLGGNHRLTLDLRSEMSYLHWTRGLSPIANQREVWQASQLVHGAKSSPALFEQLRLGNSLVKFDFFEEGTALLEDAMDQLEELEGSTSLYSQYAMSWLAEAYARQGRFDEAQNLMLQYVGSCKASMPAEYPVYQNSLRQAGIQFAQTAQWKSAYLLFQELLVLSHDKDADLAAGLILDRLTGNKSASPSLLPWALSLIRSSAASEIPIATLETLLLLDEAFPAQELAAWSNRWESMDKEPLTPTHRTLLELLIAYRQGHHANVIERAQDLRHTPNPALAVIAKLFTARSYWQLGQTQSATEIFDQAQKHLQRVLRVGYLGPKWGKDKDQWLGWAGAIVAETEAENLIHGNPISEVFDADYLAASRERWQPIRDSLDRMDWLARARNWMEAKEALLTATSYHYFDWEAALHWHPALSKKAAALFVITKDRQRFEQLCERLLQSELFDTRHHAEVAMYAPWFSSVDLLENALNLSLWPRRATDANPNRKTSWSSLHTHYQLPGILHYRHGDYAEAEALLTKTRDAYNIHVAGPALSFSAMAAWHLGKPQEARRSLAQAEGLLSELHQGTPDLLVSNWQNHMLFEISFREAQQVLNHGSSENTSN